MPVSKGQWRDPYSGILYKDRVIPVRIFTDEASIKEIVQRTIVHYQQLAVMYYVISNEVEIVTASEAQKERFTRNGKVQSW